MSVRIYGRVGRGLGWSAHLRVPWVVIAIVVGSACPAHHAHGAALQRATPPLLVEVSLEGVGSTTVEALLIEKDSTLLLPAADLSALLGTGRPPTVWVSLAGLRAQWPTVTFDWQPRALLVTIADPGAVLPASRSIRDKALRVARGGPSFVGLSGPFLSVTGDDQRRSLVDGGYNWRGRVFLDARRSSMRGSSWNVSLAPVPQLFVGYSQGEQQPATVQGRIAAGPAWLQGTWTRNGQRSVDALVQLGPLAVFGSSRNAYAITLRGPISVQLGRIGSTTTGRISYGPFPLSPFVVPQVP